MAPVLRRQQTLMRQSRCRSFSLSALACGYLHAPALECHPAFFSSPAYAHPSDRLCYRRPWLEGHPPPLQVPIPGATVTPSLVFLTQLRPSREPNPHECASVRSRRQLGAGAHLVLYSLRSCHVQNSLGAHPSSSDPL